MVKKSKKKEDETKKGSRKMRQPWRDYRKLRESPRDLSQSIWYREADCYSKNRYMLIGYKDDENDTHTNTRTSSIDIQPSSENVTRLVLAIGKEEMSVKNMMEAVGLKTVRTLWIILSRQQ